MMLFGILALLTLGVLAVLALPLLHRPGPVAMRRDHDLEVYRQQLLELGQDRARGAIAEAEAAAARTEIERRILRAGAETDPSDADAAGWQGGALLALLAVPAMAAGLYIWLGQPGLPGQPFADRAPAQERGPSAAEIERMVANLAARLQSEPGNFDGWLLLGRSYSTLRRHEDAGEAYARAAQIRPDDPAGHMGQGESETFATDGVVTPVAQAAFRRVLALDPRHPGARYYLALARAQAGDLRTAFDDWLKLAADTPANASWRPALEARLSETARTLNVNLAEVMPKPAPPAADQDATIRAMVDRLAERLKAQPDDFDGWMRLGRARRVLGEFGAAEAAYAAAAKLRPETAEAHAQMGIVIVEGEGQGQSVPPGAVAAFRRALATDPDHEDALWYLGQAEALAGRREAAVAFWRRLLGRLPPGSPDHEEVKEAIVRLEVVR